MRYSIVFATLAASALATPYINVEVSEPSDVVEVERSNQHHVRQHGRNRSRNGSRDRRNRGWFSSFFSSGNEDEVEAERNNRRDHRRNGRDNRRNGRRNRRQDDDDEAFSPNNLIDSIFGSDYECLLQGNSRHQENRNADQCCREIGGETYELSGRCIIRDAFQNPREDWRDCAMEQRGSDFADCYFREQREVEDSLTRGGGRRQRSRGRNDRNDRDDENRRRRRSRDRADEEDESNRRRSRSRGRRDVEEDDEDRRRRGVEAESHRRRSRSRGRLEEEDEEERRHRRGGRLDEDDDEDRRRRGRLDEEEDEDRRRRGRLDEEDDENRRNRRSRGRFDEDDEEDDENRRHRGGRIDEDDEDNRRGRRNGRNHRNRRNGMEDDDDMFSHEDGQVVMMNRNDRDEARCRVRGTSRRRQERINQECCRNEADGQEIRNGEQCLVPEHRLQNYMRCVRDEDFQARAQCQNNENRNNNRNHRNNDNNRRNRYRLEDDQDNERGGDHLICRVEDQIPEQLKQHINRQCCEHAARGHLRENGQECELNNNARDTYEQCTRRVGLNPNCEQKQGQALTIEL